MNHRDAWDLIPWLINGRLDAGQRAGVERHLDECAECRSELQVQCELMQAMNARPLVEAMPRASLRRLWDRIDAESLPAQTAAAAPVPARARRLRWLAAAAAGIVLALGLALTLGGPWRGSPQAEYRTVSDPGAAPAAGSIRAVFAGDLTVAELQALLQEAGLRARSGPTASGVYTLAPAPAQDPRVALEILRSHPGVRFAEPAGEQSQ